MNRIKHITILTFLLLSSVVSFAQNTGWRATPKTVNKVKDYLEKLDKIGYCGSVLIAINVSLCGPHSLDTSTFGPTTFDALAPAFGSDPFFNRY